MRYYEADELRERFAPGVQPLHELYADMLGSCERIEPVRSAKLYFNGPAGVRKPLVYFHCVLGEANWPKYERVTAERLSRFAHAVA